MQGLQCTKFVTRVKRKTNILYTLTLMFLALDVDLRCEYYRKNTEKFMIRKLIFTNPNIK